MNTNTNKNNPAVVCVSGLKNSGKTTLIEALIPLLRKEGIRTAVIKHHGHGFGKDIPDKPGSDTYRFLQSGALGTVVYDDQTISLVKRLPIQTDGLINLFPEADLIILEGAKTEPYPRIVMLRTGQALSDVTEDIASLLCIVTDPDYETADGQGLPQGIPHYYFGDYHSIATLLLKYLSYR
jgi:molybdopterin-guanine dinucleotide biosynthesis protein B